METWIESKNDIEDTRFDKESVSRRSVDWRDSGIVIDDDFQLNSMDFASCEINSTPYLFPSTGHSSNLIEEDRDGDTMLHLAVVEYSLEKVEDLIQICDLNAINNMMHTPLHVATMANRPEVVKLLLDCGAKMDVHDCQGNTPLHRACQKGYTDIVTIMLDKISSNPKEYIQRANFEGQTCLHLASLNDHREIIGLLVNKYRCNINCQDNKSGQTILHRAIGQLNVELIKFILNFKEHCNQQDFSGRRPLDAINKLLNSNLTKEQKDKLPIAKRLVEERIKICIQRKGCCLFLMECQANDTPSSGDSDSSTDSDDSSY